MKAQVLPRLTESEVVAIAAHVLRSKHWAYDEAQGLRPRWQGIETDVSGREGEALALWSVGFTTPAEPFDPVDRFLTIDDHTGEPVYVLLGPGRYNF